MKNKIRLRFILFSKHSVAEGQFFGLLYAQPVPNFAPHKSDGTKPAFYSS